MKTHFCKRMIHKKRIWKRKKTVNNGTIFNKSLRYTELFISCIPVKEIFVLLKSDKRNTQFWISQVCFPWVRDSNSLSYLNTEQGIKRLPIIYLNIHSTNIL